MTEVVVDSDYQSLQHFVSDSPWSYRPVMDQVALDADQGGFILPTITNNIR
jgi:hypothetical protein